MDAIMSALPASRGKLEDITQCQHQDQKTRQVINFTENGWPASIAPDLLEFHAARGYLSTTNDRTTKPLLMYNNRLVIPEAMRREMLKKIHDDGHLSLVKCRQRIAESVWWPGINGQLKAWIDRCGFCQEHRRRQHAEPLQPTELPERPWSQIGVDFACYEGRQYLVVVDYFSRWLEVLHMTSTTSARTIDRLRGLFARFGIPETLRSDGGPQFTSHAFAEFAATYGFTHRVSSPHNPRSNGTVERAVQTAKRIIQQPDPTLALLAYRNTPLEVTGHSPAQLFMGRHLRTRLPVHPDNLVPQWPDFAALREHHQHEKFRQKEKYDGRHGAVRLAPPASGGPVRVRHDGEKLWRGPVHIIGPADQPNSFLIPSPATEQPVVRNRRFILPVPSDSRLSSEPVLPPVSFSSASAEITPTAAQQTRERGDTPPTDAASAPPSPERGGTPPTDAVQPPPGAAPKSPPPPRQTRSGRHVRNTKSDVYFYY